MKQKRSTEEQIAFALRQVESGTAVTETTRKLRGLGADVLSWEATIRRPGVAAMSEMR